ncbi:hypothetical protein HPP92_015940 [Vanilla planifolia]|nr:hypothetical protein HPP92_015940 [Vanilla planifolia]
MACLLCVVLLVSMAAAAVAPPSRAVDLLSVSKRRVPKGPDPVHNREFGEVPQGRIAPSGGGGLLCFAIEPHFYEACRRHQAFSARDREGRGPCCRFGLSPSFSSGMKEAKPERFALLEKEAWFMFTS